MEQRGPTVRVWDPMVRLLHWALALSVASAWMTKEGWGVWHERIGYMSLALVTLRLVWGLSRSPYARFAQFVRAPADTLRYARRVLAGRAPRHVGHNPLGGWMVLAFVAILLTQAVSGLFVDDEIATQGPLAIKVSNALVARMSQVHAFNQWLVVGAVALHLVAIATYQWGLRVNLVGPMVHGGSQPAEPGERGSAWLALVLVALAAAAVYYLVVVYPRSPPA